MRLGEGMPPGWGSKAHEVTWKVPPEATQHLPLAASLLPVLTGAHSAVHGLHGVHHTVLCWAGLHDIRPCLLCLACMPALHGVLMLLWPCLVLFA